MPNAIVTVPEPRNEPVRAYAPGTPERESLKKTLDSLLSEEVDIPLIIGGEEVRTGDTAPCVCPHDHGHQLGVFHQAGEKEVAAGDPGLAGRLARVVRDGLGGPGGGLRQGGGDPRRPPARPDQRLLHARPVEDRPPGGDRRRLRADRLLALQPLLHARALRHAVPLHRRRLEPGRVPAAGGLRLRRHALQLRLDQRQPAHRAGDDGQRRALEAGVEHRLRRLPAHEGAGGGGAAAGGHQLRSGPGRYRRRSGVRQRAPRPASTSPAPPAPSR